MPEGAGPPARSSSRSRRLPRRHGWSGADALLVFAFPAVLVFLVAQASRLYFFGDDWSFLLLRDVGDGVWAPHNEHWSTVPLLVFRAMYHLVGIDHYVLYGLLPIALHLAIALALHRLLRRQEVAPWPAAVAVIVVLVLAAGSAENPLWDFQIGFLGSALLGTLALLAHGPTSPRLVVTWVLTVASMACSGMALPMLGWLMLYVLLRRGVVSTVLVAVPPLCVYAVWYLLYGRLAESSLPGSSLEDQVAFTWTGIASVWQRVIGIPGTGGLIVLAMAVVVGLLRPRPAARDLALAGLAAMCALYLLVAPSRAGLGTDAALAGRYSYVAVLMTAPAFAAVLGLLADRFREDRARELQVATAILVVLVSLAGVAQTLAFTDSRLGALGDFEDRTLASVALLRTGEPTFGNAVDPTYNPQVTRDMLLQPGVIDAFPAVELSDRASAQAAITLQVTASADSLGLPYADRPRRVDVTGEPTPDEGCADIRVASGGGTLSLAPREGGRQLGLVTQGDTVSVQAVGDGVRSDALPLSVEPGELFHVGSLSSRWVVRVVLPAGPAKICAAG